MRRGLIHHTYFALIVLLFLGSCMQSGGRTGTKKSSDDKSNFDFREILEQNSSDSSDDDTTVASGSSGSGATSPTGMLQIPSDAKHCSWAETGEYGYIRSSTFFGEFNLCQSSTNSNVFYFQQKNPVKEATICIFPLHYDGDYVLSVAVTPICLNIIENMVIYKFSLERDHSDFGNYSINGALLLKEELLSVSVIAQNKYATALFVDAMASILQYNDYALYNEFNTKAKHYFFNNNP